jgi:hypothetical protein
VKTRLTRLLGIEAPIICGGMMRVDTQISLQLHPMPVRNIVSDAEQIIGEGLASITAA